MKKYFIGALLFLPLAVFAEINVLGGISLGFTMRNLEYDSKKFSESNVPLTFSLQGDYFPSFTALIGASIKTDFTANFFNDFDERNGIFFHQQRSGAAGGKAAFSFSLVPSVNFRYIFKNEQYLSYRLGFGYFFSYYNLDMITESAGTTSFVDFTNQKNAFGFDMDVYYKLGTGFINHGFCLNFVYTFVEHNNFLYDNRWRQVNGYKLSFGYRLGFPIALAHEKSYFGKKQAEMKDDFNKNFVQPFTIKPKKKLESSTAEDSQKAYADFLALLQKNDTPILVEKFEKRANKDNGISLILEYRNISNRVIKNLKLTIVPFDEKNKPLARETLLETKLVSKPNIHFLETVLFNNVWTTSNLAQVKIVSIVVVFEDDSEILINNIENITLTSDEYTRIQQYQQKINESK